MDIPSKSCSTCSKIIYKKPTTSKKDWEQSVRFCSRSCSYVNKSTAHLKEHQFKKGQRPNPATEFKKGQTVNEKNVNWKGEQASYNAKHIWVANHFGKPKLCEHCGVTDRKMYHWANISRQFKRERSDWLRLCVPCHKKYDLTER